MGLIPESLQALRVFGAEPVSTVQWTRGSLLRRMLLVLPGSIRFLFWALWMMVSSSPAVA